MNDLIFTAATTSKLKGNLYLHMADLLVDSLRTLGGFEGDILIYTDDPAWFRDKGVRTKTIPVGLHPLEVRFTADLDFSPYRNILFLDCDILCIARIDNLFAAENEVLFVYENTNLVNSKIFGHYFLTEEERERHRDEQVINAGTYCVDADYYPHFSAAWRSMWERFITHPSLINNPYNDQSMLNALLRRGQINCRSMGKGVVEFPFIYRNSAGEGLRTLHENCKFVHYNSDLTQQYKDGDFKVISTFYERLCNE